MLDADDVIGVKIVEKKENFMCNDFGAGCVRVEESRTFARLELNSSLKIDIYNPIRCPETANSTQK